MRTSGRLGRHPSEIRTGCANKRPSGSVRGATSNGCPYRDRQLPAAKGILVTTSLGSSEPSSTDAEIRLNFLIDRWHARQRELREVFEHHLRLHLDNVGLPERTAQRANKALGQL